MVIALVKSKKSTSTKPSTSSSSLVKSNSILQVTNSQDDPTYIKLVAQNMPRNIDIMSWAKQARKISRPSPQRLLDIFFERVDV